MIVFRKGFRLPVVPREVNSIPVADCSHCIKGATAIAEGDTHFRRKFSGTKASKLGMGYLKARFHVLLQTRGKVRNHGDGLADLLKNQIQQDFLALGGDVVEARTVARRV
jgi:hypothetical protein